MVERRKELNQRYKRKKKLAKLKGRMSLASTPGDKDLILQKILKISPWWSESATPPQGGKRSAPSPRKPKPATAGPRKKPVA